MAGQKTVPMSDYFSLFIVSSDFIQIRYEGGHLRANIMYYHIYLYHGSKYNYYCVITQILQNGQTLGQFFELLYVHHHLSFSTHVWHMIYPSTKLCNFFCGHSHSHSKPKSSPKSTTIMITNPDSHPRSPISWCPTTSWSFIIFHFVYMPYFPWWLPTSTNYSHSLIIGG